MKQMVLSFVFATVGLFGFGASADQLDGHITFKKAAVHGHLYWEKRPVEGEEAILRVEFKDMATHAPVDVKGPFQVDLWMPEMGHGSSPVQIAGEVDDKGQPLLGVYRISKMYFIMSGDWEVHFTVPVGDGTTDQAVFNVNVAE